MDNHLATANAPEPQAERDHDAWSSRIFWWLFLLLVVYPLGVGPAAHLQKAFPAIEKPIEAAYLPLVLICNRVPALDAALRWYVVGVWRYPPPPKP